MRRYFFFAFGKSFKTNIDSDYHTVMLKVWASLYYDSISIDMSRGEHHALWATFASYKPADEVMEWILNKPKPYFVKMLTLNIRFSLVVLVALISLLHRWKREMSLYGGTIDVTGGRGTSILSPS